MCSSLTAPREPKTDQTVDKVLAVLVCVASSSHPLSAKEIAVHVGRPLSTVYRYLSSLKDWDLVNETLDGGRFVLGARCVQFYASFYRGFELPQLCRTEMQALVDATSETVLLTVPMGHEAMCVESIESPQALRYSFMKGAVKSILRGASAKVMLPYLSEAVIRAAITHDSSFSAPEANALFEQRERIAQNGHVVSESEVDEGTWAVGAPILMLDGTLIASISLVAPSFRLSETQKQRCVQLVVQAARRISSNVFF